MKIENRNDALESIDRLLATLEPLTDSLAEGYDTDINDWGRILRFQEKILQFPHLLLCENIISSLITIIGNNLFFSNEEERFHLQKTTNTFYRDILIFDIEEFIKICKTWKFIDYRCINFQQEVKETMESLLDFYSAYLNSWQKFISNMKCVDSK